MTNEGSEVVQRLLGRMILELSVQGYGDDNLRGAMRKVEESSWVSLRQTRKVLSLSKRRKEELACELDNLQDEKRREDARLARKERCEARGRRGR